MSDIDHSAAIDEALMEATENEGTMITEIEPDPVAEEPETVQEEVDLGQYFQEETQGGLQEQETPPETLEEAVAVEQEGEQDPPSIEERLDDLTELVGGLHELLGQLVGNMEEQSKSIDSIGARVIESVSTVMQHGGAKATPVKPPVAPAAEEETQEKGPSEAEKANLETITALKERRT